MSIHQGQSTGEPMASAFREHSTFFLSEGIILIVFGALAIFLPLFSTIGVMLILGWISLGSGIVGLITTFGAKDAPGFWWSLVSAINPIGATLN